MWKRLFQRAEKPVSAYRKGFVGVWQRLFDVLICIPQGAWWHKLWKRTVIKWKWRMRVMMYYWRYDEIMRRPGMIIVLYWCLRRFCFMKIFCQYFLLPVMLEYSTWKRRNIFGLCEYMPVIPDSGLCHRAAFVESASVILGLDFIEILSRQSDIYLFSVCEATNHDEYVDWWLVEWYGRYENTSYRMFAQVKMKK